MSLNNKVAFITGGTKGIGLGIAEAMLAEGMNVAITGRSQASVLEAENYLIDKFGDSVLGLVMDVRSLEEQELGIQQILKKWGAIDVVIANAGIGHFAPIESLSGDQWNEVIDVNLTGVFYTTKVSLDALKKSKGYLITVASLAGCNFFPTGAAYNASKFGLVGFTQAVMLDIRQDDIKVTTIMPGSVATHFNNNVPSEKDDWKIQPEDLGEIVVDLLKLNPRTLPSKIEIRPSKPPTKK